MAMMQTGSVDLNSPGDNATQSGDISGFTQVNFPTPFPEGTTVIVIPMVQTFNGPETPGVRLAEVTTTGFKIRMNELIGKGASLSGNAHTTETIGWVAYSV
ncbi:MULTISPECIES: hypothetical protein [Okeania]|uniref:H-type lectin domain-containing protein n=1 Tax=Okeania hirsuta TaxID=1458930 RepID=A0A3N6PBE1_9CYAN|nr:MULTISPECIES: hypothetical protein [Okeania]NES89405.1 hypothetical protein [Okeania sp. SIO2B9]RQH12987.1 hypothetical protein D4Z78_24695 [Okeania hirsuta]RQH42971.1 hypothetical protein D5R40_14135 [Okeania hirsuta]